MGINAQSEETAYRRCNGTGSPTLSRSEIKITYKTSADPNNNNNNNGNKEDEFDSEITTLGTDGAEKALASTSALPHGEALDKLKEIGAKTPILPSQIGTDFSYKRQVVWSNALGFLVLHFCAAIGVGLVFAGMADYRTVIYCKLLKSKPLGETVF